MILYRAVGLRELQLTYALNMRAFPPRLPEQPIFYPVLTRAYAEEIARKWNANTDPFAGYVTRFEVDDSYLRQFEIHKVGAQHQTEYWIPADQLSEFNAHILRRITVPAAYFGDGFVGAIPDKFGLRGKNAVMQFVALAGAFGYSGMDFRYELILNHVVVFLNYAFWTKFDFCTYDVDATLKAHVLRGIKDVWSSAFHDVSLPGEDPGSTA